MRHGPTGRGRPGPGLKVDRYWDLRLDRKTMKQELRDYLNLYDQVKKIIGYLDDGWRTSRIYYNKEERVLVVNKEHDYENHYIKLGVETRIKITHLVSHHNGDLFGKMEVELTLEEATKYLKDAYKELKTQLVKRLEKEIIDELVAERLEKLGIRD